jgi:hypothetical protein
MMARVPVLLTALWWGSLTTISFLVVPLLFVHLPTPAMAGSMAAKLFSAQTWVSLGCGVLILIVWRFRQPEDRVQRQGSVLILIISGMLLALLSEFAVAPRIVARDSLRLWHTIGSGMYLLQWLCASALLWIQVPQSVRPE